jgi:hypothetical protein
MSVREGSGIRVGRRGSEKHHDEMLVEANKSTDSPE